MTKLVGEETGPATGKPPAVSNETKAALADAQSTATGTHVPGQNAGLTGAVEGGNEVKSDTCKLSPSAMEDNTCTQPL